MSCTLRGIGTSSVDNKLIQFFQLYSAACIFWLTTGTFSCLLQLFHHVAFAFTAAFGLIPVYTQVFCNVVPIYQVMDNRYNRYNHISGHYQKQ